MGTRRRNGPSACSFGHIAALTAPPAHDAPLGAQRGLTADDSQRLAVGSFLRIVERRLRRRWVLQSVDAFLPIAGAITLIGALVAWRWAVPDPALVFAALTFMAIAATIVVGRWRAMPPLTASLVADRTLRTGDALTTYLTVPPDHAFGPALATRAAQQIRLHHAEEVIPPPRVTARIVVGFLALIVGVAMSFLVSPRDRDRRSAAGERATVLAEADRIDALAEQVRAQDGPATDELAEELSRVATELRRARTLARAEEVLRAGSDRVAGAAAGTGVADPLAERAAVRGLERSLQARPVPWTPPSSAAEQLRAFANDTSLVPPNELAATADRFDRLADTQDLGNPEVAASLRRAAAALRDRDFDAMSDALRDAADAHERGLEATARREQADGVEAELTDRADTVARERAARNASRSSGAGSNATPGGLDPEQLPAGVGGDQLGPGQLGGISVTPQSTPGDDPSLTGGGGGQGPAGSGRGTTGQRSGTRSGGTGSGSGAAEPVPEGDGVTVLVNGDGSTFSADGGVSGGANGSATAVRVPLSEALASLNPTTARAATSGLPPESRELVRRYFAALAGLSGELPTAGATRSTDPADPVAAATEAAETTRTPTEDSP